MREPISSPYRMSNGRNTSKRHRKRLAKYYEYVQKEGAIVPLRYLSSEEIKEYGFKTDWSGWNKMGEMFGDLFGVGVNDYKVCTDGLPQYHINISFGISRYYVIDTPGWYRLPKPNERGCYVLEFKYGYPKKEGFGGRSRYIRYWESIRRDKYLEAKEKITDLYYKHDKEVQEKRMFEASERTRIAQQTRPIGKKFWSVLAAGDSVAKTFT